jgi:uncharacterized cupredoxin-like copper-binding protein
VNVTPWRRSARGLRRAAPWLSAGVVLAVLAAAGGARAIPFLTVVPAIGYAHPAATNETVYLNMTDAPSFVPRTIGAAPGTDVSVHLNNTGHLLHSFTLSNQSGVPLDPSWSPAQLNASFAAHPPTVNVSVPAGGKKWANFSIPATASYDSFEFVSQVPYQFQAGMWGYLNVSSNTPGLLLSDNASDTFRFIPDVLSAQPAHFPVNIAIDLHNIGVLPHTFTLAAQSNVSLSTVGYFKANPALSNVSIPTNGTKSAWANFTVPAAGVYEYVCLTSGHFQNGMYGYFYVGVLPPPPAAPPSTAIVESWVLAGSAILLGIGVMLVVVAGFTGRFSRPAPPPDQRHP